LENGRFDLSQVEGLADLIDAETEAQRKQALKVLSGDVSRQAEAWRRDLIRAAALLEATIDFADEDVPVDVGPEVLRLVEGVVAELRQAITGYGAAERIRQGFEVAIVGRPNAGKSTLLNALAGREAAITSETAGTTRDVIEVRMDVDGLAVTFLDTAGLRVTEDDVERIGVRRAIDRAAAADLRIFLLDREGDVPLVSAREGDIVTLGKADLNQGSASGRLSVSGKTGAGIGELIRRVSEMLGSRSASAGIITRERQRQAVSAAISSMESACDAVRAGPSRTEIAAELLRRGVRALDSLVGRVDVEDLLDDIFARFCIGK
jgi:tRNA modification GTPase